MPDALTLRFLKIQRNVKASGTVVTEIIRHVTEQYSLVTSVTHNRVQKFLQSKNAYLIFSLIENVKKKINRKVKSGQRRGTKGQEM